MIDFKRMKEQVMKQNNEVASKEAKKMNFFTKLHDFRIQTILMAVGGLISAVTALFYLLAFQIDRMYMGQVAFNTNTSSNPLDGQIFGLIVFTFAVITLILGIYAVYNAFPYIAKKDKLSVKKWFIVFNIILSVLSFCLAVFAIIGMIRLGSHVAEGGTEIVNYRGNPLLWIPITLLALVGFIYNAICFIPTLSVKTYMPEFFKENK